MKATVNVLKGSAYAKYNKHTFKVMDLLSRLVALSINGVTVDFSHTEVIIVNVYEEYRHAKTFSTKNKANLELYFENNEMAYQN